MSTPIKPKLEPVTTIIPITILSSDDDSSDSNRLSKRVKNLNIQNSACNSNSKVQPPLNISDNVEEPSTNNDEVPLSEARISPKQIEVVSSLASKQLQEAAIVEDLLNIETATKDTKTSQQCEKPSTPKQVILEEPVPIQPITKSPSPPVLFSYADKLNNIETATKDTKTSQECEKPSTPKQVIPEEPVPIQSIPKSPSPPVLFSYDDELKCASAKGTCEVTSSNDVSNTETQDKNLLNVSNDDSITVVETAKEALPNVDEKTEETEKIITAPKVMKVVVKPAPKDDDDEEFLKKYDDFEMEQRLPNRNCVERIVFIIDSAEDETVTNFRLKEVSVKPLDMIKRVIDIFVGLKSKVGKKKHEYAIAVLNSNSTTWLLSFTKDTRKVLEALKKIQSCVPEDIFKMNTLFDVLQENVELPSEDHTDLPSFVVRAIMLYGRSYTIPEIEFNETAAMFLENPFFVLDVVMTHERVSVSNHCIKIFEILQNLDKKGIAYFFPVSRNSKRIHNAMGKLLSHSLQRPIQKIDNSNEKV